MANVSGGGDNVDPNLIPLLDLVLQLVMFFIMVANFAAQQVSGDVMLPLASSARPPDPNETIDVLYINLNNEGKMIVPGREPMSSLAETKYYLISEFQTAKRAAEGRGEKTSRPSSSSAPTRTRTSGPSSRSSASASRRASASGNFVRPSRTPRGDPPC